MENPPSLADKVAFLSSPATHAGRSVNCRETHMSFVFLTDERVYKLKKPVRFPYLNFRELDRREWACREELRLNRRLARDVYLGVLPLVLSSAGLSVGGDGQVVDWLVVMRRLDEANTLEHAILSGRLTARQVMAVASTLVDFYRHAAPVFTSPDTHLADWRASLNYNRRILVDPRFGLPSGLVSRIDRVQRRFLARHSELLRQRIRERWLRDVHGDLRPEHIWLDDRVRIIDALEFNPRLRANDPFDEVAFLDVECERLGAAWAGQDDQIAARTRIRRRRAGYPVHLLSLPSRDVARAPRHRPSARAASAHARKMAEAMPRLSRARGARRPQARAHAQ